MKHVFITGGAGFIGSHLVGLFLEKGWKVTVLDDLSTGNIENVSGYEKNRSFRFVKGTVIDEKTVNRLVRNSDLVVHLAAAVGVRYIIDNPLHSLKVNLAGTESVMQACERYSKKVLIASTSEVYGKNEKIPFREGDDSVLGSTTIIRWSYACSKAIDEFLAMAYYYEKKLPVVIMRFFNTCGPRQTGRYGMVIPRFVQQALSGKPLTIYGDGEQTRCFSHVDDVIRFVYKLSSLKKSEGEVFNIGSTDRVSIRRLAELVIKACGSTSSIKFIPYEKAFKQGFEDMRHRVPDISKLVSITKMEPRCGVKDIISDVVDYYRSLR